MPAATQGHKSIKHDLISKDSTTTVIAVGIAVFVVIFCLFALRALFSQSNFHRRVISEKEAALNQLEKNATAVEDLRAVYTAFVGEQQNILGGSATGTGPIDGDNAQLIIDALPGAYDFPALSSSMEKILRDGGYNIGSIGGSDTGIPAEVASTTSTTTNSAIEIPYSFSINSSLEGTKTLLQTLERSIRPLHVTALNFQGGDGGLRSTITFKTYYAPEKKFELGSKEVQ